MRTRKIIGIICIVAAFAVLAAGFYIFWPKIDDYRKSRDLYNEVEKDYTKDPDDDDFYIPEAEDVMQDQTEIIGGTEKNTETEAGLESVAEEPDTESETESNNAEEKRPAGGNQKLTKQTLGQYLINNGVQRKYIKDFLPKKVDGIGLKKENRDYIGWIYIPRTNVSYPVVLSRDNSDYLHTNFRHEYNYPGTIFMDCRNKDITDHHCILYGHNMLDGTMFAGIKGFTDADFAKQHPFMWIITPKYNLLYQFFSAYISAPADNVTYGIDNLQFSTNEQWDGIVKKMQKRSAFGFDVDVDGYDFVVTLSTCTDDSSARCVASAVLIGSYSDK